MFHFNSSKEFSIMNEDRLSCVIEYVCMYGCRRIIEYLLLDGYTKQGRNMLDRDLAYAGYKIMEHGIVSLTGIYWLMHE